MLGSLAEGTTEVEGFLEGEDALATLQAFRDMGVVIEGPHHGRVTIHGVGLHGLKAPVGPLYMGNSGTSMRLLSGLLAAQPFDTTLTGDASLSKRPMNRVAKPLREMGAVIETGPEGRPPLIIKGGQRLTGMAYEMPMASAQVKSCLLLAGLYAAGSTSVTEPAPTRDHTERMLRGFGYPVSVEGSTASVESGHKLTATRIEVPADISSAACFLEMSSPVTWSTCFIDRRTLPRLSKPRSFTLTVSPSLTTSDTLLTRFEASSETCTRPSRAPKKFTKAPKSTTLTTLPS
jgi:3-phosphoshikimate 1-carboxyvinyltransferase